MLYGIEVLRQELIRRSRSETPPPRAQSNVVIFHVGIKCERARARHMCVNR